MDWTPDAIERLKQLWSEGLSTAEIGRRLNISKNAVVGKAHRLSLNARPSPIRRNLDAQPRLRQPVIRRPAAPTLPPLQDPSPRLAEAAKAPEPPWPAEARPAAARHIEAPAMAEIRKPVPGEAPAEAGGASAEPLPRPVRPALSARPAPRHNACCWPIGEPGTPDFHFCGEASVTGRPYCEAHADIAYVRVRDRREHAA